MAKKPAKKKKKAPEEDLWFDAAKKLGKEPEVMTDYNFKDDNRRTFAIVGSIFAVFVFGAVLFYLYYQENVGEIEDIKAESGQVREKPEDPGGMEVDHQDRLIFDKVTGKETELEDQVQPTPEQPLDDFSGDRTIADLISETEPNNGAASTAENQPPPATGQFIIQLGAFGQQTGAENAWAILKNRYSGALGSLALDIQPVTASGGQTLYRLRAGYFASRDEAERVCDTLKQLGQDCLTGTR